jgi:general L-amino acid transport system substrate-binding protein
MKKILTGAALVLAATVGAASAQATLTNVKARGVVNCGVGQGLAGFSAPNDKGEWHGLDADICRAMAAAIFGDNNKVKFVPLSSKDRFTALQSGEVDLLSRNTTWTMSRDTQLGFNFAAINYYDGQGFMVKKSLKVTSAKMLDGASVCTQTGTTTELNVADYFKSNNLKYQLVAFGTEDETNKAYDSGRCDVLTTDASGLYSSRTKLAKPDDHIVLPEIISKEPLGPTVRHGDEQWTDLVRWTHYGMVTAEELGVTSKNVAQMVASTNPEIKRLLGTDGSFGEHIGLTKDWMVKIITQVGNYGESFEKHLGPNTKLAIARGQNALWTKGGLQYAPPIR